MLRGMGRVAVLISFARKGHIEVSWLEEPVLER
jgi:hypothetical protein